MAEGRTPARVQRPRRRPAPGLEGLRGKARPIVVLGGPGDRVLRARSRPVPRVDRSVRQLIADMVVTMRRAGGVGLAAPQVGVPRRVLVADAGTGLVVLVNPRYRRRWGSQVGPEGCLSIPGTVVEIRRAEGVEVAGANARGRTVRVRATGLLARALQHEIDHLNGILIIDRLARQSGRGTAADGVAQRRARRVAPAGGASRRDR